MKQLKKHNLLSPQQQSILSRLLPVARLATSGHLGDLPVRPRTHSLMIGPSGGGKSHLVRTLATQLDLPVLVINVSSWVVLSARNEPWTFSAIAEWLFDLRQGGILVLDEIDKLGGDGSQGTGSDWRNHIQMECHDLLDAVIPLATRIPTIEDEFWKDSPEIMMREVLAARLREQVFIIGCGAWQHAWRGTTRKLGFNQTVSDQPYPDHDQILQSMQPELRQRFQQSICWLEPMANDDYLEVSSQIEAKILDPSIRRTWNRLAPAAIAHAATAGLGMRAFEELMLTVLLDPKLHDLTKFRRSPNPWID